MKILMLCFNQVGQGTYLRAFEFARSLTQAGHATTIVATSHHRRTGFTEREEAGVTILETPDLLSGALRSGWDPYNVIARVRHLRGGAFDLVHAFDARPTAILPARSLQAAGVPLVLDWADWFGRGGSVEERPNPLIRSILRPVETHFENRYRVRADFNTVICSTLEEKALALGVARDRLARIPNGFNIPGWKRSDPRIAREKLGLPQQAFLVGYVGALFRGDATLMEAAFEHLHRAVPPARLLHIGCSNYRLPAKGSVITTGSLGEEALQLYLAACDLCWMPIADTNANRGRLPIKFSAMLSAGKPLIVTDVGDIPAYVTAGQVGITCAANPAALAEAAQQLYDEPSMRTAFADNALRLSGDPAHTWQARTTQLLEKYAQIT